MKGCGLRLDLPSPWYGLLLPGGWIPGFSAATGGVQVLDHPQHPGPWAYALPPLCISPGPPCPDCSQACAEQGSSGCSTVVTTPQETAEVEEAEAEEAEPEEVKALRPYHETQRVNPRVEPRSLSWE